MKKKRLSEKEWRSWIPQQTSHLDKRWTRAEKEFMDACNIPGVDPALIHRHANRIRLIVVELVGKLEYLINLLGESHEKKSDL